MYSEKELKIMISKFFESKKNGRRPDRLVRDAELICFAAQDYDGGDRWILKFKNGSTVTNGFGKKLFFQFG